jgi:acyl carrier protein
MVKMEEESKLKIKEYIENDLRKGFSLDLDYDTLLVEKAILNSILLIDLVLFLEGAFDVKIHPSEVTRQNFKSINTIVELMEKKKKK